ncbi:putative tetratricopeptide-like helical domain, DYW domain-containing protein [Rosa chinensis]|uniref:Putative tetratricopeptide-like helical domain, DYW domain-containing protein n=1 Tax=Rosa chinensis TaxID=74649 RepID=A0A2P6Q4V0_ROSCH|nr:pentatricopeptide repeat-containing protein DOT4, chloroplastic [Rosa chinensis]PRQ29211.1 putative tetratricopeptide-like helical domain, DYW domain-containing protein [Rosa chinensis]
MLMLCTASPNQSWVSPSSSSYHDIKPKPLKPCFIFFKPNSTTSLLSLNFSNFRAKFRVSATALAGTTDRKTADKNVKISELCELGNLKEAVEMVCGSESSDLELVTYCSVLELCAGTKSLQDGKRVHSVLCDHGVDVDGYVGAKLVFMYVHCGDLREARRVFDELSNAKVFLWNLLINEYAKIRNFREGVYLFGKMQELGIHPNSYTFSCILKCFAALGCVKEGEWVHGYVWKLGFSSDNTVVNSLMAFYFKNRRVESARKVFDELRDRDVISWNSMISAYVSNGAAEKGVEVFRQMFCSGIDVDLATIINVLMACSDCGDLALGRVVHAYAIKAGFDMDVMLCNNVLDMYSKCGDLSDAVRVFEKMGQRSVVSWTSMIAGYVREGLSDKAIELFCEMEENGVSPDGYTITSILHACACSGSLEKGKDTHKYIREHGMDSSLFVCNSLMDMYAKCGSMEDADSVFSHMLRKDIVSWNTMIGGYSKNCLPNETLELFSEMQQKFKPDSMTIASVLPACASLAALDRGQEIHGYLLRNGYFLDRYVANALVDMYVKCGVLVLAQILFDMIPVKDLISWTVIIAGYGMHGFGREAIAAFNEMKKAGIEPDSISFISILYACSHSGLVQEGWRFFDIMRNDYKIEPMLEHYACMVDLLARTGNLTKAYKFINMMPIEPDATVWGSLLCGCRIHHDVKLAEKVAEHVFELEPENTGYYILLANIYAEAEKWEEVKKLRERIGRRGLKKNPGCSWIEIKGKVNIFVAGDTSHPEAMKIESLVKKFRLRMKEDGYNPKMQYALINADEVEKEVALCGHSEKLAIAFGILNLPPGKTIRVTKNLRACGDCHEMAKFISKTSRREIVLRDSNRFHHMKDGNCSCRGFW